jgi:hypothetical protein
MARLKFGDRLRNKLLFVAIYISRQHMCAKFAVCANGVAATATPQASTRVNYHIIKSEFI